VGFKGCLYFFMTMEGTWLTVGYIDFCWIRRGNYLTIILVVVVGIRIDGCIWPYDYVI
jgi:hypothetical protein